MRDAVAAQPVEGDEAAAARRDGGRRGGVAGEVLARIVREGEALHEPAEHVAERGLAGFRAPEAGERRAEGGAFETRRQRPGGGVEHEEGRRGAEGADEGAGPGGADRGQHDVRVDRRYRDAGGAGDAGAAAPVGRERAGGGARGEGGREAALEAGDDAGRVARAGAVLRLEGGEVEAAGLAAGELPDQPVAGLDEAVGFGPEIRGLLGELRGLGEQPLAGELAAEVGEEAAAAGVDRLGVGLRGGVLPELDVGVRAVRVEGGERGAVGPGGQGRGGGEGDADAGDVAAAAECGEDRLGGFEVVGGHLQREAGGQRLAAGEGGGEDAVGVGVDGVGLLRAGLGVDQHAARGLRAEVEADEVRHPSPRGRGGRRRGSRPASRGAPSGGPAGGGGRGRGGRSRCAARGCRGGSGPCRGRRRR